MDDILVERVLRCVEQIPVGRVVTYGDVAAVVGTGARVVGQIMSRWSSDVPWWRVVNASGCLAEPLTARARSRWSVEGTPLRGEGVDLARCRHDLRALEAAWAAAVEDMTADGS